MTDILFSVIDSLAHVSESAWDNLVDQNDPFTRHDFLLALEASGSACAQTGWRPCHLLGHRGGDLVVAVVLYQKTHSYGEYIFDWSWANAAQVNGIPYFPKLVSAIPFTPVTGRRILTGSMALTQDIANAVLAAIMKLAQTINAGSVHCLFVTEEEQALLCQNESVIGRLTHQYHWKNTGYRHFDDWLATFRARKRKEVRRERALVESLGVKLRVLVGPDILDAHWIAIEALYRDTVSRKGGMAYLSPDFFAIAQQTLSDSVIAIVAEYEGRVVASSLYFRRGEHLYGRYWGCEDRFRGLHFELCYHRPIQLCIDNGWSRFEAGAQGAHKMARGLVAEPTYSVHWIGHQGLHRAVKEAVLHENTEQLAVIEHLKNQGPFHRSSQT